MIHNLLSSQKLHSIKWQSIKYNLLNSIYFRLLSSTNNQNPLHTVILSAVKNPLQKRRYFAALNMIKCKSYSGYWHKRKFCLAAITRNIILFMIAICLSYSNAISETQALKTIQKKNTEAETPTTQARAGDEEISGKGVVEVGDVYIACKYYFSKIFTTRESIARKNICNGYFFGSTSILLLLQNEGVATSTCIPKDISTEDIIRDFIEWTDKNQDKMKLPASGTLLQIFRENYTCNEYKQNTVKNKAK